MSVARDIHDMFSAQAEVADLYTARGTHDGCGECCSRFLPLTRFEVRRMASLRDMARERVEFDGTVIDLTCPFLVDRRCAVYGKRPIICRVYDCAHHAAYGPQSAVERMPLEFSYEMYDMWEVVA